MSEGVRLSKLMSERGLCSRREADVWIEKGWVFVDGQRISELGTRVEGWRARQVRYLAIDLVGFGVGQLVDAEKLDGQVIAAASLQRFVGDALPADLDSREVFRELQERFEVFLIYPRATWEERRADIDAEIQRRVVEAGGMHGGVPLWGWIVRRLFTGGPLHPICLGAGAIRLW